MRNGCRPHKELAELEFQGNPSEKRSTYRYRYLAEVSYGSGPDNGKGFIQDISLGGMLISAQHKLAVGTEILLTIPFPKSHRYLSLHGKVTRVTREGFAITFRHKRRYRNFSSGGYWEM